MDRDEGPGSPFAPRMDRPGEDALADAALAAQQDRRIAGRDLIGNIERLLNGFLQTLQFRLRAHAPDLVLQGGDAAFQAAYQRRSLEDQSNLIGGERFGEIIE